MDNNPAQPQQPVTPGPMPPDPNNPANQVNNGFQISNNMPVNGFNNQMPHSGTKIPGRVLKIIAIFPFFIALLLFLVAYVSLQSSKIPSSYKQTTGTVYSLSQVAGTQLENNVQVKVIDYSPNIEFSVNGSTYKFHDTTGTSPSEFHVGQTVNVAYNPSNPGNGPKNASDKTGVLGAVIFGVLGGMFFMVSVVLVVVSVFLNKKLRQV